MKCRYINFIIATSLINLICWYYAVVFCRIYSNTSGDWLFGAVAGLIIDWGIISIIVPLIRTCTRMVVRNFPKLRFIMVFEYFLWIKDLMG